MELRPDDRVPPPPRVRHRGVAHLGEAEPMEITGPAELRTATAATAALDRAGAAG